MVPDRAILMLCAACVQRTRKLADDRGDDAEYPRLVTLAQSLAGEVWTDDQLTYWFRDPLSVKKQPSGIPMWIPEVRLPAPWKAPAAPKPVMTSPRRRRRSTQSHRR